MAEDLMEITMLRDSFIGAILSDEPMRRHTTLRIGGPADVFAEPADMRSLVNLLAEAREKKLAIMPLGGGSNLLVVDEGIRGIVISTESFNYISVIEETGDAVRLNVGTGTPLQRLVNLAREKGLTGIEGLAGIPGSVGGAIKGNAGSFGCEIGTVIEGLSVADKDGSIFTLGMESLGFGYRSSAIREDVIITEAAVRLAKGDAAEVAAKTSNFLREKRMRQPISEHSAGCVFRNPAGDYAGRLIDESGCKGMRRGDIEISALHANFFINKGNGSSSDFISLMEAVEEMVLKSFGIELEPEINIVDGLG